MSDTAVTTVSRDLPRDLQRQILRCALAALNDAGTKDITTSITPTELIVSADIDQQD